MNKEISADLSSNIKKEFASELQSLEQLIASLFVIGISNKSCTSEETQLIKRGIGGVVLFKRNIETPTQLISLINSIQSSKTISTPLMICVDQEGGRVARVKNFVTNWPSFSSLGAIDFDKEKQFKEGINSEATAFSLGKAIGEELSLLGFSVNFAPVLDILTNKLNPVIGDRAISSDKNIVSTLGSFFIKGMQSEGIAACAKHFPGHGDTSQDSHETLPTIAHSKNRLMETEIVPFKSAIQSDVASIMTAHIIVSSIDRNNPSTLSSNIINDILRSQLNFNGVIFSDDLEMKAISANYTIPKAVELSLLAGVDSFLICHSIEEQNNAIDYLIKKSKESELLQNRIYESALRLYILRKKYKRTYPIDSSKAISELEMIRNQHALLAERLQYFNSLIQNSDIEAQGVNKSQVTII